jgi:glycogen operon protein
MEWNDKFRDGMRHFWLGWHAEPGNGENHGLRGLFARRLCGSDDLFRTRQRLPLASVNYVVSHDGFTLRDLVSYNQRHNQANGEDNRDGHGDNRSFNCGVEGPTTDAGILALRGKLQRALLACTVLSQGTPMLAAGAELGHTQGGNNNPYNQDNATTWIDWSDVDADLLAFTRYLLALRRSLLPLGPQWYTGLADASGRTDLTWLRPDGSTLRGGDWGNGDRTLGCLIGRPGRARGPLLLLVNAQTQAAEFVLPAPGGWAQVLDTTDATGHGADLGTTVHGSVSVAPHSLQLLAQTDGG